VTAALLLAMSLVLVSWAILALVLAGIGLGLARLFGIRSITTPSILVIPWVGYSVVILLLQLWHFVLAIWWPTLLLTVMAGAAGMWASRRELGQWLRSIRIGWIAPTVFALGALWLSNRAIGPGSAFDSGLYHYAVVRWSHEYSIVPGLANLHPNYGFNSSCHLFVALLHAGFWEGRANHLANGLLLFIWLATITASAVRVHRGTPDHAGDLCNLVFLIPIAMYAVSKEASSPTSDLPQAMMSFAAASAFVRLLAGPRDCDPADIAFLTTSVILICSAALCVKLTAATLVVPIAVIALVIYVAGPAPPEWRWKTVVWSCGLSLLLGGSWIGRSIVLSGYPVYPSRVLPVSADWRVAPSTESWFHSDIWADAAKVRIGMLQRAVATSGFERLPSWITQPIRSAADRPTSVVAWIAATIIASTIEIAMPLLLALAGLGGIVLKSLTGSGQRPRGIEWIAILPPILAIGYWLMVAPEPRFLAAACWILAAIILGIWARAFLRTAPLLAAVISMSLLPVAYRMLVLKFNPLSGPVSSALFIPAGPDHGFHPVPVVELVPTPARWPLVVLVPKEPGPPWDAPLPATAVLDPRLSLRDMDDMGSGFRIR
jgi:hypothetical protein